MPILQYAYRDESAQPRSINGPRTSKQDSASPLKKPAESAEPTAVLPHAQLVYRNGSEQLRSISKPALKQSHVLYTFTRKSNAVTVYLPNITRELRRSETAAANGGYQE